MDKAIIELFINDGELYFVKVLNSVTSGTLVKVFANGLEDDRKTILKKSEVNELNSV